MARCRKRRYATRALAWLALDEIERKKGHKGKVPIRAYRCNQPQCRGAWHLTSQVRRRFRRA